MKVAVLFYDSEGGTGYTGGESGTISEARAILSKYDEHLSWYIYSIEYVDPNNPSTWMPDESLAGPLDYSHHEMDGWHYFTLDVPVEVPGEFFIVADRGEGGTKFFRDTSYDEPYHSRFYRKPLWGWEVPLYEYNIRIEWESDNPSVEATTWGAIKASLNE